MNHYYKCLNLEPGASLADLKKAYRKMALKYHPDRNPHIKNPEEVFSKINQAYKILSEYVQSAEFDPTSSPPPYHNSTNSDTNSPWSEEEPTQAGAASQAHSQVKSHYKYSLLLTFEECASGCSKVIHFYKTSPLGQKEEVRLETKIPRGVKEGQKLTLKKEGPVLKDGTRGDLFIYIDVLPHPIFERKGRNVYMDLPIGLSTAILGGKVMIPTLSGKTSLSIPPDTHSGRVFRLKKKGFSHVNSSTNGDMLVKVVVDFPGQMGEEELRALKILSDKTPPLVKEYNLKLQDCLANRKR